MNSLLLIINQLNNVDVYVSEEASTNNVIVWSCIYIRYLKGYQNTVPYNPYHLRVVWRPNSNMAHSRLVRIIVISLIYYTKISGK